jgi:GNAT superfamily N-acetyltransferase
MTGQVEILVLRSGHADALMQLFDEISRDAASANFHPHPFDAEWTERICRYQGKDLYFGLLHDGAMVGYGMLRGWDDGYDVPSLGIFLSSKVRGTGLARLLMQHLHMAAKLRGSSQIRLKVYPENIPARRLYERLGYHFAQTDGAQLVGLVDL